MKQYRKTVDVKMKNIRKIHCPSTSQKMTGEAATPLAPSLGASFYYRYITYNIEVHALSPLSLSANIGSDLALHAVFGEQ